METLSRVSVPSGVELGFLVEQSVLSVPVTSGGPGAMGPHAFQQCREPQGEAASPLWPLWGSLL